MISDHGKCCRIFSSGEVKTKVKQTRGPQALQSPDYQRLYTDFFSEGLVFVYQQPHHRKNENQ